MNCESKLNTLLIRFTATAAILAMLLILKIFIDSCLLCHETLQLF